MPKSIISTFVDTLTAAVKADNTINNQTFTLICSKVQRQPGPFTTTRDFHILSFLEDQGLNISPIAEDPSSVRITGLTHRHLWDCIQAYKALLVEPIDSGFLKQVLLLEGALSQDSTSHSPAVTNVSPIENPTANSRRTLADAKLPYATINWPRARSLTRYQQLHFPRLFRNKDNPELKISLSHLPKDAVIVDAGCGDGEAIASLAALGYTTVAYTMHQMKPPYDDSVSIRCYSPVPNGEKANALFTDLQGRCDLVFDTYGPATYADNPLHALIYLGLLLKQGGTARVLISSILGDDTDQSPIGYSETRQQIIEFFANVLGLELKISRNVIQSAMNPEDHCIDFNVTITRTQSQTAKQSLKECFDLADATIGTPKPIIRDDRWGYFDDQFKIIGNTYLKEKLDWQPHMTAISACVEADTDLHTTFQFNFDESRAASTFANQFAEYYVNHSNPDWTMQTDYETRSIRLTYHDFDLDIEAIKSTFEFPATSDAAKSWNVLASATGELALTSMRYNVTVSMQEKLVKNAQQQLLQFATLPGLSDSTLQMSDKMRFFYRRDQAMQIPEEISTQDVQFDRFSNTFG